jgi:hypothetical protein
MYWFQRRCFLFELPIGSCVKLSSAVQPSCSEGGTTKHNFGRGPSNDYFISLVAIEELVPDKKIFM